jgi:hypothetical protein
VRRELGTCWGRVLKVVEGFGDVIGHGNVASAGVVVPNHGNAGIKEGSPVDFGVVMET